MQYIFSKLDVKYKFISNILLLEPTLLYLNGHFLEDNLKKVRLSRKNIQQKVRSRSGHLIEDVTAVVLESNGELSVIIDVNKENINYLKKYE